MTLTAGPRDARHSTSITPFTVHGPRIRAFQANTAAASAAWPAANRAYYVPVYVTSPLLIVELAFVTGTTPGTANFDLGIYRDDFTRLVSVGATAAVNTSNVVQPTGGADIQDLVLTPGRYYLAMSAAATSITVTASTAANGFMRAVGVQMQESAHPLPSPATPISVGTSAFMPMITALAVPNVL